MTVNNISRHTAQNFPWKVDNRHWLISIYSSRSDPATITAPFGKVVFFQFDDIDEPSEPYLHITAEQAASIAATLQEAKKEGLISLWFHCDAGVCRSGAVVEASLLLGCTTDEEVSNEGVPNRLVFNEVRKALGFKHSFEAC